MSGSGSWRILDAPVRGHNKAGRVTKEPNISPQVRIDTFSKESLVIDKGKLFCSACHSKRSLRLSSLKVHINSDEHKKNLSRFLESLDDDEDVASIVTRFFDENPDLQGAGVAKDTHVHRWRVM